VFFNKGEGRSFLLVGDSEEVESFVHPDDLIDVLKAVGITGAEIHY